MPEMLATPDNLPAGPLVQRDRTGDGDVQRLGLVVDGDGDPLVTRFEDVRREARALRPEDEDRPFAELDVAERPPTACDKGDPTPADLVEAGERHAEDRAG